MGVEPRLLSTQSKNNMPNFLVEPKIFDDQVSNIETPLKILFASKISLH